VSHGARPRAETPPLLPETGVKLACAVHFSEYSRGMAPEVAFSYRVGEARCAGGERPESGGGVGELGRGSRRARQGLGTLAFAAEVLKDAAQRGELDDEGDDAHLGAAEAAQQRIDLVDLADELAPGDPALPGPLVRCGVTSCRVAVSLPSLRRRSQAALLYQPQ